MRPAHFFIFPLTSGGSMWDNVSRSGRNTRNSFSMKKTETETVQTARPAAIGAIVGTFHHALDGKKRLTIPSEWRDAMGRPEYVYVLPDMKDSCLTLMPPHEMDEILDELKKASPFDAEADELRTAIGQCAQMVRVDSAWRIRINDDMLEFADIHERIALKGSVLSAKVWAEEKVKPSPNQKRTDIAAARAAMAKLAARRGA